MSVTGAWIAAAAAAGTTSAEPLGWTAPPECPPLAAVEARIAQRRDAAVDGLPERFDITVVREADRYVATIDARAPTASIAVRTLTAERCDELAEGVALVIARLLAVHRAVHRAVPTEPAAALEPTAPTVRVATVDSPSAEPRREAPRARGTVPRWGGGAQLAGRAGVGAVPEFNLGTELGAWVRRDRGFIGVSASAWRHSIQEIGPGGAVAVGLTSTAVRAGRVMQRLPGRVFATLEVGTLAGEGMAVTAARTGRARWLAAGAGATAIWPLSARTRVVGTVEVLGALTRPRFVLEDGTELYRPASLVGRFTLGLEVGWR